MPYEFPSRADAAPIIYAYSDTRYPGMLKVGYHSKLSSAEAMLNGLGMTSHHNDLSLPAHEKSPATLEL